MTAPDFKLTFEPLPDEVVADEPCPDDIVFSVQPFSLDFHPSEPLIASGLVSGAVCL